MLKAQQRETEYDLMAAKAAHDACRSDLSRASAERDQLAIAVHRLEGAHFCPHRRRLARSLRRSLCTAAVTVYATAKTLSLTPPSLPRSLPHPALPLPRRALSLSPGQGTRRPGRASGSATRRPWRASATTSKRASPKPTPRYLLSI